MAVYTNLSQNQLKNLVDQYNIGSLVSSTVLSGGSENTNYKLETTSGEFVLTLCEQSSEQETKNLADLLLHLENNQFTTSKVIPDLNGKSVGLFDGKSMMIKNHLPGTIVKDLSNNTLLSLGHQLAKLHLISAPPYLKHTVAFGKESFDKIEVYAKGSTFHSWLLAIRKAVELHCHQGLPTSLIHSDVFYDNVIISPDGTKATIMDFEEACHYYRVFDIGMMLVGLCEASGQLNSEKVQHVLLGYQKLSRLQENEQQALQVFTAYAAAATAFWRHRHYHYVMPDAKMQNHYLHMKNLADSVLGIPEDNFVDLMNYS